MPKASVLWDLHSHVSINPIFSLNWAELSFCHLEWEERDLELQHLKPCLKVSGEWSVGRERFVMRTQAKRLFIPVQTGAQEDTDVPSGCFFLL